MKRRLKKSVKIFLVTIIVLIILLISMFLMFNKLNRIKQNGNIKKSDLVNEISNKLKDYDIDTSFIKWVDINYKGSLKKLAKLLENNDYNSSMWHKATNNSYTVLNDLYNKAYDTMDNVKIIDSKLGSNILDIMKSSDIMIANSEFTVSNRGTKLPNKTYTFRAKPERLSIYDEMGIDLVTLANNHVYDYGLDAFNDMLDTFNEYKIPHIGAGHNIEEAKKPYYFIINGYKIAFVSATRAEKNIMTPGATDDIGGVFRCYDPTDMINLIKELKSSSDYVIPIIHFGRENYI